MNDGAAIGLGVLLLAGNAFFVAASFAIVSARSSKLEPEARAGSRAARSAIRAIQRAALMMAGAQLGITICTLGLGALTEPALTHLLEPLVVRLGLPDAAVHPVAFVPALLVVVVLHVVLGEMAPKNLTLAAPERVVRILAPALAGFVRLAGPIARGLNAIAGAVLRLVGVQPRPEVADTVTQAEVGLLLAESRREGLIDPEEHQRTSQALAFTERPVTDAMIGLADLSTIGIGTTPAQLEALAGETGHSRFPRLDADGRLVGYVHLLDAIRLARSVRNRPLPPSVVRPLLAIPAATSLARSLTLLRRQGSHLARVAAEDGTTLGAVTLDGILLRLVPDRRGDPEDP